MVTHGSWAGVDGVTRRARFALASGGVEGTVGGMGAASCTDCVTRPVMRCGRCNNTRCKVHALRELQRCECCERDWREEAVTRRAAKLIFAPPLAILAGGLLFGMMLPISLGGAIGAAIMCALACISAVAVGSGACRLVDHSARAMFLRERAGGLPPARLLPSSRHRITSPRRLLPAPRER
jgi:hypothetical protein